MHIITEKTTTFVQLAYHFRNETFRFLHKDIPRDSGSFSAIVLFIKEFI
jgi:hypothetical protein